MLSEEAREHVAQPITNEEIRVALFNIDPWKAPGPDGFPAGFFHSFWEIMEVDICCLVRNIFHTSKFPKGFNSTIISVIPKTDNPQNMSQFRLISLCNTPYKVVSKILVQRIRPLMDSLISPA